jgi:molybdopterin molybdotransferase
MPENLQDVPLRKAQTIIKDNTATTSVIELPLAASCGFVHAEPCKAKTAIPHFSQSLMDGFAINSRLLNNSAESASFKIVGEVAAGDKKPPSIKTNQAVAIFTGAMLPHGANQVVPTELCRVNSTFVEIPAYLPKQTFIKKTGADIKKGSTIAKPGRFITPVCLATLASAGINKVKVYQRPKIALLCTGSELLELSTSRTPPPGKKTNSNALLLTALIKQYHGIPINLGIADDKLESIVTAIQHTLQDDTWKDQPQPIFITTGGMGLGKYDLMPSVLNKLGAPAIFNSIKIRPGRRTAFASPGKSLFFALPGPPGAVATLFHELIGPAILRAQGLKENTPIRTTALLTEKITIRRPGLTHLKSGQVRLAKGKVYVTPTGSGQPSNATIITPANRSYLKAGSSVRVHILP